MQGPPNKRHYHKLLLQPKWDQQSSGENSAAKEEIKEAINFLQTFVDVFSSEEIFLYLSNTTGGMGMFKYLNNCTSVNFLLHHNRFDVSSNGCRLRK